MDDIFYVYVLLDPRKPGRFSYSGLTFDFEPFYVGKGKGRRVRTHRAEALLKKAVTHKRRKILSIMNSGREPYSMKVFEGLLEYDALVKEQNLIGLIGRHDKGNGPLTNVTDGGVGGFNKVISSHQRQLMRDRGKKRVGSANPFFGKNHNQYAKDTISTKASQRQIGPRNPFFGRKHCASSISAMKEKLHAQMLGDSNPFYGIKHTENTKSLISSAMKRNYLVTSPSGLVFQVVGLMDFCRLRELKFSVAMEYLGKGVVPPPKIRGSTTLRQNTTGWSFTKVDETSRELV